MKIVFCFLFASFFQTQIHKHSRSLLYNCWRRIEEGFSSFFFFSSRKAWKKMEFGWFFIGKYRGFFLWISSGCSSAFKVVHTSRGAEPWPNQPGTSSHSFLQLKKKNQTHLSSFHFSEKWNKLVWQSTAKRGENWNEFVLNKLNLHPIG